MKIRGGTVVLQPNEDLHGATFTRCLVLVDVPGKINGTGNDGIAEFIEEHGIHGGGFHGCNFNTLEVYAAHHANEAINKAR